MNKDLSYAFCQFFSSLSACKKHRIFQIEGVRINKRKREKNAYGLRIKCFLPNQSQKNYLKYLYQFKDSVLHFHLERSNQEFRREFNIVRYHTHQRKTYSLRTQLTVDLYWQTIVLQITSSTLSKMKSIIKCLQHFRTTPTGNFLLTTPIITSMIYWQTIVLQITSTK